MFCTHSMIYLELNRIC